jgi:hypothetical protein
VSDQWWNAGRQGLGAIPFRNKFDQARDPLTARNAIGAVDAKYVTDAIAAAGGGGGGAPTTAEYITAATNATLSAERVLTNTATVTWDFSTPGQAKASTAAGGGNVSNSGTPTTGQYGKWVTATTIQGVAPATVLSDIGAQPAGSYQPLDSELTAIAGLTSAADQAPYFTGAGTAALMTVTAAARTVLDDTTVGAMLTTMGGLSSATAATTYQPLDADLTAIAALAGTGVIYYRSAADTWSPVVVSTGLAFSGGNLTATGGTPGGSNTHVQYNNSSAFGGSANFVWNNTTSVLTVTGQLSIAIGNAMSIVAAGAITANNYVCAGTLANLAPASSGNVVLRPSGPLSTTGQVQITTTSVVMNNPVTLPADPTLALQAATKQYVDTKAPLAAEYITSTADATLTAERVLTDTATVTWDRTTAGQIKANATAGGGSAVTVVVQKFAATSTYTPTASMRYCTIECVGGGGGGGGIGNTATATASIGAGGGGAGGYSRVTVSAAAIGASKAVTIGTAGSAGTAGGGNGGAGGATSVGSLCIANGGAGGGGQTGGTLGGGAGGVAAGAVGDVTTVGAPGDGGASAAATLSLSAGNGGSSFFGGGALGPPAGTGASTAGVAGTLGGGGSGAVGNNVATTRAGGAGGLGYVVITEYI